MTDESNVSARVGDELPELCVEIDARRMFFFSAAAYNGHRIHYDHQWTTETEGYPGLIVQGHLQSALLARAVTDWAGPQARLERFGVQNRGAAMVGESLVFGGRVEKVDTAGERTVITLSLHGGRPGGDTIMPGTAVVSVPSVAPAAGNSIVQKRI